MARDRNYEMEYKNYQGTPEQIKKRSQRNKARRELEKAGRVHKGDGKDVGHKTPIDRGGTNAKSNLQVQTVTGNRGWRKGKRGAGSYDP